MATKYVTAQQLLEGNVGINDDEDNVPNLDGMTTTELSKFRDKYRKPSLRTAIKLVGNRTNAIELAQRLAKYALFKAKAMRARGAGNLRRAVPDENFCDSIYSSLPKDLKW